MYSKEFLPKARRFPPETKTKNNNQLYLLISSLSVLSSGAVCHLITSRSTALALSGQRQYTDDMNSKESMYSWHLSLRVDRPVEVSLVIVSGGDAKMDDAGLAQSYFISSSAA